MTGWPGSTRRDGERPGSPSSGPWSRCGSATGPRRRRSCCTRWPSAGTATSSSRASAARSSASSASGCLSFAPLPATYARPHAQLAICSPLLAWQSGPGYADKVGAETDIQKLLEARDPIDAQSDFNALIAITSEALRNAPPGTARGGYVAAMNDFRTAGLLLGGDKVTAALAEIQDGITADQKATRLLTGQEKTCRR